MINALVDSKLRVHATAPTNIAVTEIAKRFRTYFPKKRILIVGTLARLKLSEDLLPCHFDTKVERIKCSVFDFSLAQTQLLLLVATDPTSNNPPIFTEVQEMLVRLHISVRIIKEEAVAGLMKEKIKIDIQPILDRLIGASSDEFMDWFSHRSDESIKPRTAQLASDFLELASYTRGVIFKPKALSNLKLLLLSQADVYFSTVNVGGREIFSLVPVDVAIIDEATQLLPGDIATMFRSELRCLVLVGDEKQLPAVVQSSKCRSLNYDLSLFDRLIRLEYPFTMLNVQYRMHPLISRWPSHQFYNGQIEDGESVLSSSYSKSWHQHIQPLELFDIREGREDKEGTSLFHEIQAMVVRRIIASVIKLTSGEAISIGVISPYKQQVNSLSHLSKETPMLTIKVCTIDGFQGQEADIIILTTVRSNPIRQLGFLSDLRRLNVGITRSKYSMILIGDVETISSDPTWRDYLEYFNSIGKIHSLETSTFIKAAVKATHDSSQRFRNLTGQQMDPFKNALWTVIFSSEFKKSLQNKDAQSHKDDIMKKVLDLAYGVWLKWESKNPYASENYRELIHVQKVKTYSLIWTIDFDRNKFVQCLKIWDLVAFNEIPKCIRHIENSFQKYSEQYLDFCKRKQVKDVTTKKTKPFSCLPIIGISWYLRPTIDSSGYYNVAETSAREDESIISKFYQLSTSVAQLLLSSESVNFELPFVMSPEEDLIVTTPLSMFILGRSGTGTHLFIVNSLTLCLSVFLSHRENHRPLAQNVLRKRETSDNRNTRQRTPSNIGHN
jgi:hypothetical protein